MRKSKELQLGKAGEYMVCADLILKGLISYPSEQGLPYDVLCDTGEKLLKIQVKTTSGPRVVPQRKKETRCYIFNIKRNGKNGRGRYGKDEIDLFALVCIDSGQIGYITPNEMPDTINIRVDSLCGTYYDEKGVADFHKVNQLYNIGKSQSQISVELGISASTVSKMLQSDYTPHLTSARYMSDFIRDNEWFYGL